MTLEDGFVWLSCPAHSERHFLHVQPASAVLTAHARDELGIDPEDLANPVQVGRGFKAGCHFVAPVGGHTLVLLVSRHTSEVSAVARVQFFKRLVSIPPSRLLACRRRWRLRSPFRSAPRSRCSAPPSSRTTSSGDNSVPSSQLHSTVGLIRGPNRRHRRRPAAEVSLHKDYVIGLIVFHLA